MSYKLKDLQAVESLLMEFKGGEACNRIQMLALVAEMHLLEGLMGDLLVQEKVLDRQYHANRKEPGAEMLEERALACLNEAAEIGMWLASVRRMMFERCHMVVRRSGDSVDSGLSVV
jgi:hypothetical protein